MVFLGTAVYLYFSDYSFLKFISYELVNYQFSKKMADYHCSSLFDVEEFSRLLRKQDHPKSANNQLLDCNERRKKGLKLVCKMPFKNPNRI